MTHRSFEKKRLKLVATINDEALTEDTSADYELQYVDIGNVDSFGKVHEVATYHFEDAPSRARRLVRDGDVIISTVRTYLQAIAPIIEPPANLIVSTGFAVVRPKPDTFDPAFCKYALREPSFLAEVEMRSVGVSYPAINASDLASIPIHVPALPAQGVIANYLDRETARLDKLITAKEDQLKLLLERRTALITRVVTRGANPKAQVRNSSLHWLPKIPSHWEIKRGKRLFQEVDERSATGEETLLSLRMQVGLIPHDEVSEKPSRTEELIGYKITEPNDIVVNRMRAASGLVAITPQRGLVSPDYAVLRQIAELDPSYFWLLFTTPLMQAVFRSESKGLGTGSSGFLRLYSENLLSMKLPVPPYKEQRAIVAYIAREIERFDDLRAAGQRSIRLLKERRTAIIADAVTGRMLVADAV
jgi:type I restriction enzyme S subunit